MQSTIELWNENRDNEVSNHYSSRVTRLVLSAGFVETDAERYKVREINRDEWKRLFREQFTLSSYCAAMRETVGRSEELWYV